MLNTQMLFGGLTLKSFQELNSVSSDCTIYILNVTLGGRHAFATMSFIAETFIFLYVGMDALDVDKWKMATTTLGQSFGLFSTLLVLILVGRAAFVFPLSALSNYIRKSSNTKIGIRQQVLTPPYMKYAVPLNIIAQNSCINDDSAPLIC
jgi:NhaP-type Na+/H+ or K+/H+ antiporter